MLLAGAAALFASSATADYLSTQAFSDAGCTTQTSASYAQIDCSAMSATSSECLDRKRARARARALSRSRTLASHALTAICAAPPMPPLRLHDKGVKVDCATGSYTMYSASSACTGASSTGTLASMGGAANTCNAAQGGATGYSKYTCMTGTPDATKLPAGIVTNAYSDAGCTTLKMVSVSRTA